MTETSKKKKLIRLLFWRLPIFLLIMFAVLVGTLKLVERYPEPLKQGFEKFFSEKFAANATIGKLEKVTFFPDLDVVMNDLTLHSINNAAVIETEVDVFKIKIPFWGILAGSSVIKNLHLENLKSMQGTITEKELNISSLTIVDKEGPDQYGSFIVAEGSYDNKDMMFEAEINKKRTHYRIPKKIPFSLSVGDVEVNALLSKGFLDVKLLNTVYSRDGVYSDPKEFPLYESREYVSDNPLDCILQHADSEECDKYLNEEK